MGSSSMEPSGRGCLAQRLCTEPMDGLAGAQGPSFGSGEGTSSCCQQLQFLETTKTEGRTGVGSAAGADSRGAQPARADTLQVSRRAALLASSAQKNNPSAPCSCAPDRKEAVGQSPRPREELSARRRQPGVAAASPQCRARRGLCAASAGPQAAREGSGRPRAAGGRSSRPHFHTMQGRRLRLLAAPVPGHALLRVLPTLPRGLRAAAPGKHQHRTLSSRCHGRTRVWDRWLPQPRYGIWPWVLVDALGDCHVQPRHPSSSPGGGAAGWGAA